MPDGFELLVAADTKILVYDSTDGTLMQCLKGHKEAVYSVAWSADGEAFASGSADRTVIIWTNKHEGTLKYNHAEAVQCLAFSPVSQILLSCGMYDFALWSSTEKNVQKQRLNARCCSCAWNKDGTVFALGLFDGTVQLRKMASFNDDPVAVIERPGGDPVWALRFSLPVTVDESGRKVEEKLTEILAVSDWSKTLSFYDLNGNKFIPNDKNLNYEPSCMEYLNNDSFLIMAGSGKEAHLYTRYGLNLGKICLMDTMIWTIVTKPESNYVVVGCVDGTLACYHLYFSAVHGLYKDRYVFRDNMTEVIVQHLTYQSVARIKCNDGVRKVAIYGDKLAVQLSDHLNIYTQVSGMTEDEPLEFKLTDRITKRLECSLLVCSSKHIILCSEQRLQCYDHRGLKQREWIMESLIKYIRVIGGPPGRETLLVGLREGQVCKIFVDNPFPVTLLRLQHAIKCLDTSLSRHLLAVVDETGVCTVYNTSTWESILQETNCTSVAFNTDNEDIICFSSDTSLIVRASRYPGFQQRMLGIVVGFSGNKVFCLQNYTMTAFEVPFSNQLYQYIENKQYDFAYKLANLGVTEEDWKILANDALVNMELEIATRAFARIRDYRSLQLITELMEMKNANEPEVLLKAHIMSYQKRFREVATLYRENGFENKAMELFTDLKMFDDAQDVMTKASGETQKMLMRKKADWARDSNQPKVAAEMLISSGDLDKATQLIIENDWMDLAINLMRKLDRGDMETLRSLAGYFVKKGEYSMASKIYTSLSDTKAIILMHIHAGHWTDAFAIADRYPKYVEDVYLPYARYLAENDRFEEAQKAFHRAGHEQEALRVLEQLTGNAVNESRFADAGYYHWLLSMQYLERAQDSEGLIPKYREAALLAEIYYAYESVYAFQNQPFTSQSAETLLNMARFVSFQKAVPNISQALAYFTIATLGRELQAFKYAREALDQLTKLRIPNRFQQTVDLAMLTIRAKPYSDAEELLPICYRCGLNNSFSCGLQCMHCKTPFVFSFSTFEILPLLEFFVDDNITSIEAKELIEAEPPLNQEDFHPFRTNSKKIERIVLNRDQLLLLEKSVVIVLEYPQPLQYRYFYNVMPTISITTCTSCWKIFHMDDYEMAVLQKGTCPFCRTQQARTDSLIYLDDD
ncbi:unnamed protein product [Auanema sp. JU1783]|nr:unnamed protein product [Auanema sp. JU1783]